MDKFTNELSAIQNDAVALQSEAARLRSRAETLEARRTALRKAVREEVQKLLKFMFGVDKIKIKL